MKYWHYVFLLGICIGVWTCSTGNNNANKIAPPTPSNLSGQELAAIYCANCHLKPEPNLLDKKTWEKGVLPDRLEGVGGAILFALLLPVEQVQTPMHMPNRNT